MKIKLKLNKFLSEWTNSDGAMILNFKIKTIENLSALITYTPVKLLIYFANNQHNLSLFETEEGMATDTYSENNILNVDVGGDYLIIDYSSIYGVFVENEKEGNMTLYYLWKKGIIEIYDENQNYMFVFRRKSEANVVDKDLDIVNMINGKYRSTVDIMNPVIDVASYDFNNPYNYVYVSSLKRYYYITRVERISNALTRLYLHEDVLMSHKDLILSQNAYVTRQEYTFDSDLVDNMILADNGVDITYIESTNDFFIEPTEGYTDYYDYVLAIYQG